MGFFVLLSICLQVGSKLPSCPAVLLESDCIWREKAQESNTRAGRGTKAPWTRSDVEGLR